MRKLIAAVMGGALMAGAAAVSPAQDAPPPPPPAPSAPVIPIPDNAEDMGAFFTMLDADGDGQVPRAEFDAFFKAAQDKAKGAAKLDPKAIAGLGTYFGMMDANGDGTVTRAEFDGFHHQIEQDASGD